MTVVATLVVEGPSRSLATLARAVPITVDGAAKGRVRAGKRLTLALPPGSHSIQAGGGPALPVRLAPGLVTRVRVERDAAGRTHLIEVG
ncbi:hypothetical protein ACWT_5209 [Actinoplanes sp. SE50]|uniref:hypothetical protein n=1 Tax=unclassified Actinoplanes TaxID=2626549 RepID=UPI00023EBBEB|nr:MULTISPECIES: hypothetical protein [unclassified Actinoplanes]AEV86226.1 hypothetical protein ACPL_5339 [Actinoplanes sp. SE50/110]ATO84624.1 hypothetical protein ACWT_5209 [Actinoplanes sp. SE50]SLM02034.1 hypothetical protein ACSP50_5272 [Actinoplanes sp. SE50/110]